jgi:hypothetical protein
MGSHAVNALDRAVAQPRVGPRQSIAGPQSGQVILLYLFFLLPMTMICLSVFNVGQIVAEKIKVQNAADNAAYSAAVWEARYMNLTAYTSRAMVANYDTMATFLAIWSMMDALDGFLFLVQTISNFIPFVGPEIAQIIKPIHIAAGTANQATAKMVGGNGKKGSVGILRPIEVYTNFLSSMQVVLYVATQFGRTELIKSIAWSVDPKIQYNTIAEILNAFSLDNRVKWDKTDKNNGLRLTTERSLNAFSNGESLRDTLANILPAKLGSLLNKKISFFICDFGIGLGPKGFNGPPFDHKTGKVDGPAQDDDTVIVRPDELYQHDFTGISISLCFTLEVGHHSDDKFNGKGVTPPHIFDAIDPADHKEKHAENFKNNGIDCTSLGAFGGGGVAPGFEKMKALEPAQKQCDEQNKKNNDDDPNNDQFPPMATVNGKVIPCKKMLGFPTSVEQQMEDAVDSAKGAAVSGLGSNPCAPVYQWGTKLEEVKVTTYRGDDSVRDGRRVEGPTVFVYFRKKANVLPMFQGLGLDNGNDLEAYSMAKVYYMQRVGDRKDTPCSPGPSKNKVKGGDRSECNRESLFNPFWSARLERPTVGVNLLH